MASQVFIRLLLVVGLGAVLLLLAAMLTSVQEGFKDDCGEGEYCLQKLVKFYEDDHRRRCTNPRFCPTGYIMPSNPCSFRF